jgi:ribA/ribD-fused uncharacterized protein
MRIEWFDSFEGPNPYDFLSNFYSSVIKLGNKWYITGEHAFAAYKAISVKDHDRIQFAKTPGHAKAIGREIELRPDWENVKYDVMRQVLRAKFSPGSDLAERLLATGNALLIEGTNWNDQVWGTTRKSMFGRNWLGHLLMARRAELATGEPEADYTVAMLFIRVR